MFWRILAGHLFSLLSTISLYRQIIIYLSYIMVFFSFRLLWWVVLWTFYCMSFGELTNTFLWDIQVGDEVLFHRVCMCSYLWEFQLLCILNKLWCFHMFWVLDFLVGCHSCTIFVGGIFCANVFLSCLFLIDQNGFFNCIECKSLSIFSTCITCLYPLPILQIHRSLKFTHK